MKKLVMLLTMLSFQNVSGQIDPENKLVHTYSIVARDPQTGEMGVAVQSNWFSVGSLVSWAEAGVGAIATQSFVNVSFGPRGLELLKSGKTAQEVLKELIDTDEGRDVRQLAIVDAQGNVAAHTGKKCIPSAGHYVGDNFSVEANLMLNDKVWPAMAKAFQESSGPLAERMVTVLEAAQSVGGDIRGKQSAAILVVRAKPTGKIWEDRIIDLRIEDHADPIKEIRRLLRLYRAYEFMNKGDYAVEKNDMKSALELYGSAEKLFPDNQEMKYWHAVALANNGRVDESLPIFKEVFKANANWVILTERLPGVGQLTVSKEDLDKILKQK
ncbi:DUF1028 domain-containing protein [bacterium]|nr:DUF1028 domain-containing protein [bacterium]